MVAPKADRPVVFEEERNAPRPRQQCPRHGEPGMSLVHDLRGASEGKRFRQERDIAPHRKGGWHGPEPVSDGTQTPFARWVRVHRCGLRDRSVSRYACDPDALIADRSDHLVRVRDGATDPSTCPYRGANIARVLERLSGDGVGAGPTAEPFHHCPLNRDRKCADPNLRTCFRSPGSDVAAPEGAARRLGRPAQISITSAGRSAATANGARKPPVEISSGQPATAKRLTVVRRLMSARTWEADRSSTW